MLATKGLLGSFLNSSVSGIFPATSSPSIYFCTGDRPSDTDILKFSKTYTPASYCGSLSGNGMSLTLLNDSDFPPRYIMNKLPKVSKFKCKTAGTISWAVVLGYATSLPVVVSVSLPGADGILEVDKVEVAANDWVQLVGWSLSLKL